LIFLLIAGALCACNQKEQERKRDTVAPQVQSTIAQKPEEDVIVLPTLIENGGLLPIDEEHFTSEVFRQFITKNYDNDNDGYLSEEERKSVTDIQIDEYDGKFDKEKLDGFEFFPNLENLEIGCAGEVIVQNHPSLKQFGGWEGCNIGILKIDNCPKLKAIGFFYCWIDTLCITNVPAVTLSFSGLIHVNHWVLDGDVALDIATSNHEAFVCTDSEQEEYRYFESLEEFIDYLIENGVQWGRLDPGKTPLNETELRQGLFNCEFDFFEFEVRELSEGNTDATEICGWNIAIDYEEAGYKSITFPLYTKEEPALDDFFVRVKEIQKVHVMEYSPNRGTYVKVTFDLEFIYRTEQEENVLGERERSYYVILKPDGTSKVYRPMYDDEIRQADW